MSLNGMNSETPEPPRRQVAIWVVRLLIALIISAVIVVLFFTTGAISR